MKQEEEEKVERERSRPPRPRLGQEKRWEILGGGGEPEAPPCFLLPGLLEALLELRADKYPGDWGSRGAKARGSRGAVGEGLAEAAPAGGPGLLGLRVPPPRTHGAGRPCARGSGWPRSSPGQGGEAAAVAPVPELPPGKQSVESLVVSCAAWWPPTRSSPPPLGVWIPPPRPGPSCSTRRPVVSPTPPAPCTLLSHILPFTFSVCLFCPSRLRPLLSLLSHPFLA